MTYRVIATSRAKRDVDVCFNHIASRNSRGAASWFNSYERALKSLEHDPSHGEAPESEFFSEPIREHIFKTRHGQPYRMLFVVRGEVVYVIHIRGPGQDLMSPADIRLPAADAPPAT